MLRADTRDTGGEQAGSSPRPTSTPSQPPHHSFNPDRKENPSLLPDLKSNQPHDQSFNPERIENHPPCLTFNPNLSQPPSSNLQPTEHISLLHNFNSIEPQISSYNPKQKENTSIYLIFNPSLFHHPSSNLELIKSNPTLLSINFPCLETKGQTSNFDRLENCSLGFIPTFLDNKHTYNLNCDLSKYYSLYLRHNHSTLEHNDHCLNNAHDSVEANFQDLQSIPQDLHIPIIDPLISSFQPLQVDSCSEPCTSGLHLNELHHLHDHPHFESPINESSAEPPNHQPHYLSTLDNQDTNSPSPQPHNPSKSQQFNHNISKNFHHENVPNYLNHSPQSHPHIPNNVNCNTKAIKQSKEGDESSKVNSLHLNIQRLLTHSCIPANDNSTTINKHCKQNHSPLSNTRITNPNDQHQESISNSIHVGSETQQPDFLNPINHSSSPASNANKPFNYSHNTPNKPLNYSATSPRSIHHHNHSKHHTFKPPLPSPLPRYPHHQPKTTPPPHHNQYPGYQYKKHPYPPLTQTKPPPSPPLNQSKLLPPPPPHHHSLHHQSKPLSPPLLHHSKPSPPPPRHQSKPPSPSLLHQSKPPPPLHQCSPPAKPPPSPAASNHGLLMLTLLILSLLSSVGSESVGDKNKQLGGEEGTPCPPPQIDVTHSTDVTALAEKQAILNCRVHNISNKTVSWIRHRDIHLLTVGRYTYTSDQRFRAVHKDESDDWELTISYVQLRDSGMYECQVSTTPPLSHFIQLKVVKPHTEILGGPDMYLNGGSTINLTCIVEFSPEPPDVVYWHHNNQNISYDSSRGGVTVILEKGDLTTSSLLIQKARPSDSGRYLCSPSNATPANITLHVLKEHPQAMQHGGHGTLSSSSLGNVLALLVALRALSLSLL